MALSDASTSFSFNANLRIPQSAPDSAPPQLKPYLDEIFTYFQQISLAFINNCGAGPQPQQFYEQLNGTSNTVALAGNLTRYYGRALEDIAYGNTINLVLDATELKIQKANAADNTKPCDGFCNQATGIALGEVGEVQLVSGVARVNGMTKGTRYFLSTTSGLITPTKPVAAGNIEQYLGIAIDETHFFYNLGYWVQH